MKATVQNLLPEIRDELVRRGYGLDERLDIGFVNEVADEIGIPELRPEDVKVFTFEGYSKPGRKEDGSFYEI